MITIRQGRPWLALVAGGMLLIGACAETPTAPSIDTSLDLIEQAIAVEEAVFISNAHKVADSSARPVTGGDLGR